MLILNQLNLYMEDFFLNKITVKNIYLKKKWIIVLNLFEKMFSNIKFKKEL